MKPRLTLAALTALSSCLTAQVYDYQAAATYSTLRNGHALLIAIDGQIVFEQYDNGWNAAMPHRLPRSHSSRTDPRCSPPTDDTQMHRSSLTLPFG